jgi:hypothetical protein
MIFIDQKNSKGKANSHVNWPLGVDCYKQNEILDYQPHPAKLGNL